MNSCQRREKDITRVVLVVAGRVCVSAPLTHIYRSPCCLRSGMTAGMGMSRSVPEGRVPFPPVAAVYAFSAPRQHDGVFAVLRRKTATPRDVKGVAGKLRTKNPDGGGSAVIPRIVPTVTCDAVSSRCAAAEDVGVRFLPPLRPPENKAKTFNHPSTSALLWRPCFQRLVPRTRLLWRRRGGLETLPRAQSAVSGGLSASFTFPHPRPRNDDPACAK